MSAGGVLLAQLDAMLPANEAGLVTDRAETGTTTGAERRSAGLAAAAGLHNLLTRHRFGWGDLLPPDSRLATLCGRFGSDYPAEREAAYDHAVRLIMRCRTTWSTLVRLPEPLQYLAVEPARSGPEAVLPEIVPPPETNWLVTVQRLKARATWWTAAESALLETLDRKLVDGGSIGAVDAKWLRDLWWEVELNDSEPPL